MNPSRDLQIGATDTFCSHESSLGHVYFFINDPSLETHSSYPIAGPLVKPKVEKVDPSIEGGSMKSKSNSVTKPSLNPVYQMDQSILLQPCSNEGAGAAATNHAKKQLMSNLPQETGDRSVPVPHKVHKRPLDHVFHPVTQQSLDTVSQLPEIPLPEPGTTPNSAIPLPYAINPSAGLDTHVEMRNHGTVDTQHFPTHWPHSDLSSMSAGSEEPIASAMDIGTPTVVEIPADAKSVAILKTIKADKIKRAGPIAISTIQVTSDDFRTSCADWGLDTKSPLAFSDAVAGLFGQALLDPLTTSSSILEQISNFSICPNKSNLAVLSNGPFTWISSALLEFQIPKSTSIQYSGNTVLILSANIKLDCSENGTFTALLSARILGDDLIKWTWSGSNVGLLARFSYEQDRLPVTLNHVGKNITVTLNQLNRITALDLIQTLHLPLGALINLPLVGKMLKSVLTSATFEYNHILDRSYSPSILAGRVVFKQDRLRLGSFDLSNPEISIIYSSSRSLVTVDEGQWTFKISACQDAHQLDTQVNYEAVDYLARFHVQPKNSLTLVDFLKLLAPSQVKAASQTALKDFTVDQADVVLDTSDWSAISCSGDMRFPGGLPSLFEYDAYSSDNIALTSTIDVPTHGYHVDVLAIQSMFDSRPEVLANQKETTFIIEDDEIMVAAPLNNDKLWATLALAVKENSQVGGTTIDFEADELPEIVSLKPIHAITKPESEDEGVTLRKAHRASIVQMATAVVPGSPLPSPTLVTIASEAGPAAGSARRTSRIVSTMGPTPVVISALEKKTKEMILEKDRGLGSLKPVENSPAKEVTKLQSEIFTTTWLDLPARNENSVENASTVSDPKAHEATSHSPRSFKDVEFLEQQTNTRLEKSIASSTAPTSSASVASSSPNYEQRELDQKSSTSSLGSDFQTASKDFTSTAKLYNAAEESERNEGLFIMGDSTLTDVNLPDFLMPLSLMSKAEALSSEVEARAVKENVSIDEPTPAELLFAREEDLEADANHDFDSQDAFTPTKQSGHTGEPVPAHQELKKSQAAPVENKSIHKTPSLISEGKLSQIAELHDEFEEAVPRPVLGTPTLILDVINHIDPVEKVEEVKEEGVERAAEPEKDRESSNSISLTERRAERRTRDYSNFEAVAETSPPPTPVPADNVLQPISGVQNTESQFAEHIPSSLADAIQSKPISSPPTIPKPDDATKIAISTRIGESPPIRPTTSDSPTNKRNRRKSILPSKSMRNLLKRAVSFGNLKESPPPVSRNISTSTSDTAVPLPPLIMNGSFASGTTEGWQVEAGRNTIKVLKEEPKGYKHKLVVTVRRSSLSGVFLRQRLPTEPGAKFSFKLKLLYDMHGDGFLNVLVDGREVAKHHASNGKKQLFDIAGVFVSERKGAIFELQMKSPFGKMMVFEISGVLVERVGTGQF